MIGADETSGNDKLRVAWERLGNTRARRANTAKRVPNIIRATVSCLYMFARFSNPLTVGPLIAIVHSYLLDQNSRKNEEWTLKMRMTGEVSNVRNDLSD